MSARSLTEPRLVKMLARNDTGVQFRPEFKLGMFNFNTAFCNPREFYRGSRGQNQNQRAFSKKTGPKTPRNTVFQAIQPFFWVSSAKIGTPSALPVSQIEGVTFTPSMPVRPSEVFREVVALPLTTSQVDLLSASEGLAQTGDPKIRLL